MSKLSSLIHLDKRTSQIVRPTLLLKKKGFNAEDNGIIGIISDYSDWNFTLNGNSLDEISFTVHKYYNDVKCLVWEQLIDLKTVEVKGYGNFEIQVTYTDETETTKAVVGQSLEVELGQVKLYDFHVNDEQATDMVATQYNADDYVDGIFVPTVLYKPDDTKHSLLHRVLQDKAPQWTLGYITPYVTKGEDDDAESVGTFQRTYTADGTDIYSFLTGEVAEESNVVFIFDTLNRQINMYSLYDCYVTNNGVKELAVKGIGEDTTILISKKKLTQSVTINSNKDSVKNCFRVTGGDDIITSRVAACNMSGNNYIYQFADFQLNDMPQGLSDAIKQYGIDMESQRDRYYGENGILTRLYNLIEQKSYLEHTKAPNTDLNDTTAYDQFVIVKNKLLELSNSSGIGVSSYQNYDSTRYTAITNNISSLAEVYLDSRYKIKVVENSSSYNATNHKWSGVLKITRNSNEADVYPVYTELSDLEGFKITLNISVDTDSSLPFTEQKLYKALSQSSMADIDFDLVHMNNTQIRQYFEQFSYERLRGFMDGYDACRAMLSDLLKVDNPSGTAQELYGKYNTRFNIVVSIYKDLETQINSLQSQIEDLQKEQSDFQTEWNFKNYLNNINPNYYNTLLTYIREDDYNNSNYTSDMAYLINGSYDDSALFKHANELLDIARSELKKACVLQRSITTDLNNLLILPEFEGLHDKLDLFNYFRVKTDDEVFKLRLLSVSFSDSDISKINVSFSESVVSLGNEMNDLVDDVTSILQQASSIATSYSSTQRQASQGASARNIFNEIYTHGLNAASMMLKNSNDNEVTFSQAGLLCRPKTDEGEYGPKQLRIIGSGMYLTDDAWNTVKMAVGEIEVKDPFTNETKTQYGVIADAIVGKLFAGERMYIGNEDGSVEITGDGITITNGYIRWSQDGSNGVKSPTMDDIPGLNNTVADINNLISGVQTQVDNQFVSWFYEVDPTLNNEPAKNWTTDELKSIHVGDYYYNSTTGAAYQFSVNNNVYSWKKVTDPAITGALNKAQAAQDTADCKRRTFLGTNTPTPPYDKGDLWAQGTSGDLMICTREEGRIKGETGDIDDWSKAVKSLNDWITGDYATALNNLQTSIDGKAQTWYQSNDPAASWNTDTLKETHIYDLWYNTADKKSYMYIKDGSIYKWVESDGVPKEVFDQIDGTASIFTSIPNTKDNNGYLYRNGDLLIPTDDIPKNGVTYKTRKVYKATADSQTWNNSHWVSADYIDSTEAASITATQINTFRNDVKALLTGGTPTTQITDNSVISPFIGGGYGYWTNGSYHVEIDPNHNAGNNTKNGYLFCVRKNDDVLMGVDTSGNGYFKGNVTATSLTLGDGVDIPYTKVSNKPDLTVYIKKDGTLGTLPASGATSSNSTGFKVSSEGLLTASNAVIYGTVYATNGEFTGKIHATNLDVRDTSTSNKVSLTVKNVIDDQNGSQDYLMMSAEDDDCEGRIYLNSNIINQQVNLRNNIGQIYINTNSDYGNNVINLGYDSNYRKPRLELMSVDQDGNTLVQISPNLGFYVNTDTQYQIWTKDFNMTCTNNLTTTINNNAQMIVNGTTNITSNGNLTLSSPQLSITNNSINLKKNTTVQDALTVNSTISASGNISSSGIIYSAGVTMGTNCFPTVSGVGSLGTSNNKWNNAYITNTVNCGSVSASGTVSCSSVSSTGAISGTTITASSGFNGQVQMVNASHGYAITTKTGDNKEVLYVKSGKINGKKAIWFKAKFGETSYEYGRIEADSYASDIRIKENIKPSTVNSLEVLNQIQMVQFDWTNGKPHWDVGMIADEIEKINPLFAFGGGYHEDGTIELKHVDGFYLLGHCVKAIQELSTEINELKERLKKYE